MSDPNDNDSDEQGVLLFDDGSMERIIRRGWRDGRWFFSVIDVIAVLTDSPNPGNYWAVLKRRLDSEGASEVVTNCRQLKIRAIDGKLRPTDARRIYAQAPITIVKNA